MLFFLLIELCAALFPSGILAGEAIGRPTENAAAIIEANRVLEAELTLAARPQIYMVLDLAAHVILIKSRGIELHRLPITAWHPVRDGSLNGVFRLRARPSVNRPKAAASAENTPPPAIELQHMPDRYDLIFDPNLMISIGQTAREEPWAWMKSRAQEWWNRVARMLRMAVKPEDSSMVKIHLIVSRDTARSLAWTMTDGMPLIIGRVILARD
jgi:hypothetical protein